MEQETDFLIVTDPPFGGKCELIGRTLKKISEDISRLASKRSPRVDIMWIFPYYMEHQIQCAVPLIQMSDFQVCYEGVQGKRIYKDGLEHGSQGGRKVVLT